MEKSGKKSMINCHTHIFTSKTVPPYLAKSFLPWPFYKWINTDVLMSINEFLKFDQGKWKVFYEKLITIKIQSMYGIVIEHFCIDISLQNPLLRL